MYVIFTNLSADAADQDKQRMPSATQGPRPSTTHAICHARTFAARRSYVVWLALRGNQSKGNTIGA